MKKYFLIFATVALMGISLGATCRQTKQPSKKQPTNKPSSRFTNTFTAKKSDFVSSGRNPFFILESGYTLLVKGSEEGKVATEETKVLNQTKVVDGVQTRVVKETHTLDGKVDEISLNYFAIDKVSNGVFYFGEDTDIYKNGKVVSHEGSWLSGEKGARFGLIMPGLQLIGGRYMQEIAPEVALDRAEIVSVTENVETPAGTFDNVLKVKESTPLEPGIEEFKLYAEGIGKIQDGSLKLVRFGLE